MFSPHTNLLSCRHGCFCMEYATNTMCLGPIMSYELWNFTPALLPCTSFSCIEASHIPLGATVHFSIRLLNIFLVK